MEWWRVVLIVACVAAMFGLEYFCSKKWGDDD